jgi:hypothetical protein
MYGDIAGRNLSYCQHVSRRAQGNGTHRQWSDSYPIHERDGKQGKIEYKDGHGARYHRIPDSLRAFCRIVSFTVTKTSLMLDVSVAWVILRLHAG